MNVDRIMPEWPAPPGVRAFSTTRAGGLSKGPWSGFNLGLHCGDKEQNVKKNRARLNRALPAAPQWLRQVHGTKVVRHPGLPADEAEGDALVSFRPGEGCAVLTADCLPVIFCNRSGDRVGIAHAGWRGLATGVLQATVNRLDEDPAELLAWLGPAIGPAAFEVGSDVADAFPEEFPAGFRSRGGRWLLDIYSMAKQKLAVAGVRSVFGGGFCTVTDSERFFSYRRDGVTGRMASLVWLEKSS